jgi:hypothetical protein
VVLDDLALGEVDVAGVHEVVAQVAEPLCAQGELVGIVAPDREAVNGYEVIRGRLLAERGGLVVVVASRWRQVASHTHACG